MSINMDWLPASNRKAGSSVGVREANSLPEGDKPKR